MTTGNKRKRAFRRILLREAGTGANAADIAAAAGRLSERFAQQVSPLVGDAGVAAIYDRGLHLAQRQFPSLTPVRSSDGGDALFARLQIVLEAQEPAIAVAAAVAFLAGVGELLTVFIGEGLAARLLSDSWPDDFAGGHHP